MMSLRYLSTSVLADDKALHKGTRRAVALPTRIAAEEPLGMERSSTRCCGG